MDIEIKSILLILGGFPKEDVPMLEKVLNDNAKNGDVRLAVFAFDALENTDASSANAIAQNIIEKRKDYNSAVVMAAFGAISESLMANPSTEETDKYLKLCDELLKEYPDKNIKLAMLSSVSGVGTMETVNYAIDNANNEVYKKVFVEMNSSLITTILSHDSASSDDVDFIVKCMEIYPLPEFENQLTAFLDKTTDEADKQKLNAAIKAVKSAEPSPPEN